MKVITGEFRGLKLKALKGLETRPTSGRVKESIFNIIENNYGISENDVVLDLFSGTGSIGIEFLSRGAKKTYFVDNNRKAVDIIKENLKACKTEEKAEIYNKDAETAIDILKGMEEFKYIYIDPPYNLKKIEDIILKIYENNLLEKDGYIISEHDKDVEIPDIIGGYEKIDSRVYGKTEISIYRGEN